MSRTSTRAQVRELLDAGLSTSEIATRLGFRPGTISYHRRKLGYPMQTQGRYDWTAVQAHYDEGHSIRDCAAHFGFSLASASDAVRRGDFVTRPAKTPLASFLVANSTASRWNISNRLIAEGVKAAACEECDLTEWRERPIRLQLHHVNGVGDDNRLENLQLLCPNCHSQTDTWGRKKRLPGEESNPGRHGSEPCIRTSTEPPAK